MEVFLLFKVQLQKKNMFTKLFNINETLLNINITHSYMA